MKPVFPFSPANVKPIGGGPGKCHTCPGGGSGDATEAILEILRKEHPEWFKTPKDRLASDLGHWVRSNFKAEFQEIAEARGNEILTEEVTKPVYCVVIDDKPIHFCADCLKRFLAALKPGPGLKKVPVPEEVPDLEEASAEEPESAPKRRPGRPRVVRQEAE